MPIRIGIKLNLIQTIVAIGLSSATFASEGPSRLVQTSAFVWAEEASWFGGVSGAEISDDGNRLIAVTDRGRIIEAHLERENGILTGVNTTHAVALRDATGKILNRPFTDSEGLAIGPTGQFFVSFEGQHRIAMLDVANGVTTPLARPSSYTFLAENSGLEAVAIQPDGVIIALPEDADGESFPLYAYTANGWSVSATVPRRGPFLPVGADFDENGLLYLLERTVTPLGFRSQIRRFDLSQPDLGEETLLQTLPARYDNLEALTVWKNETGQTYLTLLSDDNFLPIQQTQIIEFLVLE